MFEPKKLLSYCLVTHKKLTPSVLVVLESVFEKVDSDFFYFFSHVGERAESLLELFQTLTK